MRIKSTMSHHRPRPNSQNYKSDPFEPRHAKTPLRPAKINSMFYLNIFRKGYARARKNNTNLRKIHKLYSTFPGSVLYEISILFLIVCLS